MYHEKRIAVVIPCYRVRGEILQVLNTLPTWVDHIIVVDDCCPDKSGELVLEHFLDPRLSLTTHAHNQGVGGAMITGYLHALTLASDIVIKMDGDGQMSPAFLPSLLHPLFFYSCDYTKGNRFTTLSHLASMPPLRIFGNALLSFFNKLSSGYWYTMDPTNGFTAIAAPALSLLPLHKLNKRYFFETDMLFRLGLLNARVLDVPIPAHYASEHSSLRISRILHTFLFGHLKNYTKRTIYRYFLYDMSLASLQLLLGLFLALFGTIFALYHWIANATVNMPTPTGTVVISAFVLLVSLQLLLSYINYDIGITPRPSSASPAKSSNFRH